jgi:hypothetical protein
MRNQPKTRKRKTMEKLLLVEKYRKNAKSWRSLPRNIFTTTSNGVRLNAVIAPHDDKEDVLLM